MALQSKHPGMKIKPHGISLVALLLQGRRDWMLLFRASHGNGKMVREQGYDTLDVRDCSCFSLQLGSGRTAVCDISLTLRVPGLSR